MQTQDLRPRREDCTPIYQQLYQRYREAIANGTLRPGDRVPSVRNLASELNLARGTVEMAYHRLIGEGYFITLGAAGTKVNPGLATPTELPAPPLPLSPATPCQSSDEVLPFQLGLPALDVFPRKTWTRLAARTLHPLQLTKPNPAGHFELRRAIATYLGISRGIVCSPEQVFITIGYRGALDLICRTVLRPGDLGWFEEPGYFHARQALDQAGMRLYPVPVDADGMDVALAEREAGQARFAVVTPTHQSPMGMALSLPRRLALLDWAARARAWVIEDDYDSEFRYHGRPFPAIKSLDRNARVLYTGTFSKVLFPGVRLAYLVVPPSQVGCFHDSVAHLPGAGNRGPQATVATFMEQGHFARHLNRMRKVYAQRHGYLMTALSQRLATRLQVQPQAGGIHVVALLHEHQTDRSIATAAQVEGLAMHALSDWCMHPEPRQGLIMGFANFTTLEQAQLAVERLERVWPGA